MSSPTIGGPITPFQAPDQTRQAGPQREAAPQPPPQQGERVERGSSESRPITGNDVRHAAGQGGAGRPANLAEVVDRTRTGLEGARETEQARRAAGGGFAPGFGNELKTAKALWRQITGKPPDTSQPAAHEWRVGGANGPTVGEAATRGMSSAKAGLADASARFSRWLGGSGQPAAASDPHQQNFGTHAAAPEEWGFVSTGPIPGAEAPPPGQKPYC